ncbi:zinc finger protein 135-like [Armigeres subalbatus]|uniref:zinc finger protein 135-like n=1 Tax=Armigeres subalbatus TaxID=124917 RepID=UPI002ED06C3E
MESPFSNQFQEFLVRNYPDDHESEMAESSTKPLKQCYVFAAPATRRRYEETEIPEVPTGDPISFCRLCFSTNTWRCISQPEIVKSWIQYIAQNAGIQLDFQQDSCFAICFGCKAGLESVSLFRNSCYKHDIALKRHRAALATGQEPPTDSIKITNVVTLAHDQPLNEVAQPKQIMLLPFVELPSVESREQYEMCHACDLKVPSGQYMKHMKKTHRKKSSKLLYCSLCLQRFRKVEKFQDHALKHKSIGKMSQQWQPMTFKHKCKICKKYFESVAELSKHEVDEHDLTFNCGMCSRKFPNEQEQAVHMLLHKAGVSVGRYFKCKMCKLVFSNRTSLNAHIVKHARYYICPICGESFSSVDSYTEHQTVEHQDSSPENKCTPCNAFFLKTGELLTHLNLKHSTYDPNTEDNERPAEENGQIDSTNQALESMDEMETVSLSDDDDVDDDDTNDDLFPTYLEADGEEIDSEVTETVLVDDQQDELVFQEAQPDNGFDLYGTAFRQQITITLDDDSL